MVTPMPIEVTFSIEQERLPSDTNRIKVVGWRHPWKHKPMRFLDVSLPPKFSTLRAAIEMVDQLAGQNLDWVLCGDSLVCDLEMSQAEIRKAATRATVLIGGEK
jgi:hypothetical protein